MTKHKSQNNNLVYKYCPVSDKHLSNLSKNSLWFSSPLSFEDEYDINLPTTETDLKALVEQYGQYIENIPIEILQSLEQPKNFEKSNNKENKNLTIKEILNEFTKKFVGVTCFGKTNNNDYLWNDYGDKHRGFCLGFNINLGQDYFKSLKEVTYKKNLPIIDMFSSHLGKQIDILCTTKLNKYIDEDECRLIELNPGLNSYPKSCLTEVILGREINPNHASKIRIILTATYNKELSVIEK